MQFSTLALAALASLASAQKTTVVTVGMNGTLTFSPSSIKANVGDNVQFQFAAGNHTVTQSNFANPCEPINLHNSSVVGFYSGFQPVAASAAMGVLPTYTIAINSTGPIWIYCAQAKHCASNMSMVINENTASGNTLDKYRSLSANVKTIIPGQSGSTTTTGGSNSTTTGGSTGTTTAPGSAAGTIAMPSTLGLLGVVAAIFLF